MRIMYPSSKLHEDVQRVSYSVPVSRLRCALPRDPALSAERRTLQAFGRHQCHALSPGLGSLFAAGAERAICSHSLSHSLTSLALSRVYPRLACLRFRPVSRLCPRGLFEHEQPQRDLPTVSLGDVSTREWSLWEVSISRWVGSMGARTGAAGEPSTLELAFDAVSQIQTLRTCIMRLSAPLAHPERASARPPALVLSSSLAELASPLRTLSRALRFLAATKKTQDTLTSARLAALPRAIAERGRCG